MFMIMHVFHCTFNLLKAELLIQVKQHVFFKDINWDTLARQKVWLSSLSISMTLCSLTKWVVDWLIIFTSAFFQAAFVPSSESALDTSYFTSRYSWNTSDDAIYPASDFEDSSDADSLSGSSSCLSNRHDEVVLCPKVFLNLGKFLCPPCIFCKSDSLLGHNDKQGDECQGLAEFESGSGVNYSFSNFSFKVLPFP